jgi:hypothetical protein
MTLPIPLTVRWKTSRADRHVDVELSDLSFRSQVPGGFASARMSLSRPLRYQPDEFAYYSQVQIQDKRNGNVVFDGRLEDPGRNAGSSGEIWELAAVGPSAHAHDRTEPLVYVDHTLDGWINSSLNAHYMDISHTEDANDTPVIRITPSEGTTWVQNDRGATIYRRLYDSGQKLARITFHWDAGATTVNNIVEAAATTGTVPSGPSDIATATYNVAGGTLTMVIGDFAFGRNVAQMIAQRTGADIFFGAGSNGWLIVDPIIRAALVDKTGATITTGYTTDGILAHEVVADLLGRWLNQYDGANASIATTSYAIEQFAFDSINAAGVFEELMKFHPDHYWAAWESNSAGKHRFEWRAWPTTVRYEADVFDGFSSPGSAVELFNQVYVQWVGSQGRVRKTLRTIAVPLLDDAGLTRTGFVDLGLDAGSSANAIQAGDEFLAEHSVPLSAGRLIVARPILDRNTGIMIQPWEIRPGELIRVRGIDASQDALNTTTRDGVTVFKVVAVDYSTSSAAATLELDSSPVTLAHLIARGNAPVTLMRR